MRLKLQRTFSCAHFYHQPLWPEDKNRAEFGKCFTVYGHGHDYILDLEIRTHALATVQTALEILVQRLDHQHLNFVIPEFKAEIPTTENFSLYIHHELLKLFNEDRISAQILGLRLQESPEIWVELAFK